MKNTITNILYLIVGVGLGYLIFYLHRCNGKVEAIKQDTKNDIDTVYYPIKVEIPKYHTKYVSRTDSFYSTIIDSIEKVTTLYLSDTTKIPINVYLDSIKTDDYRFDYKIETLGHLIQFEPNMTLYEKKPLSVVPPKPRWMVSGAVSNNITFKLGVGYRGVTLEGEFDKNFKQIYIGKQFIF
jgi:hypothetical protein